MNNAFAEFPNNSKIIVDGLELNLETDKKNYFKQDIIYITWNATNISTESIKYNTSSTCGNGWNFMVYDFNGARLIPLSPNALLIPENDPKITKLGVSFYSEVLNSIKTEPEKEKAVLIFTTNKDKVEDVLIKNHEVKKVNKAKNLSFVAALVNVKEIPKIAEYSFVHSISDGEQRVCGTAEITKILQPNETVNGKFPWSQLILSKDKLPIHVPENQYKIVTMFNGITNSLMIDILNQNMDYEKYYQKTGCKEGLKQVIKVDDGYSACVKPSTAKKLVERGWAKTINNELPVNEEPVIFYTEKTEYEFGEPITISMKNEGIETFSTRSSPIGFSIIDKNGETVCDWRGGWLAVDYFNPQEIISITWEQDYCHDKVPAQVESGIYTIIGNHFINYTKPLPRLDIRIVE